MTQKSINLFYWSSILFEKKEKENYGDIMSKYIVEKVSNRNVAYYNAPKKRKSLFQKKHLMAIGSILNYASPKAVVWGSGIISKKDKFDGAIFCAVRGPKSRDRILELGLKCPEVYGDPALLLPRYYSPSVVKTHALGIIPHYVDYEKVVAHYVNNDAVKVIDLIGNDVEKITEEILSCEKTVSSSLHGLIVSHAYQIPSVWVRYSEKLTGDNVKFEDYFLSVDLVPYSGKLLTGSEGVSELMSMFSSENIVPSANEVAEIQNQLIQAFPSI